VLIKICGITRLEDAEAAVDAGADAIGFVFWPRSPRYVEPERARVIAAALPAFVTTVGVFVNQLSGEVNAIADRVRLGAIQLHGDEPVAYLAGLTAPVIKAVPLSDGAPEADAWPERVLLLLDAHDPERRGGTGRLADWTRAERLARSRRVLLAGGLRPANVADAVARVRPFGIDVSSGVEAAPGVKDPAQVRALIGAARAAEAGR
jgi:phosphoribosylanthranilate isomerase